MRRATLNYGKKVFIIDDNRDHAAGLRELIRIESNFEVVGSATSPEDGLLMMAKNLPDVALIDMNMPEMDGLTVIQKIKEKYPTVKILAITAYDDADLIFKAMKSGARGYLLKTMASSQLSLSIEEVLRGKIFLPPVLAVRFFEYFQAMDFSDMLLEEQDGENALDNLTKREEEILSLLTEGLTYRDISEKLVISETTVKTHVNNIFQKLQVNDRTQAVLYALNHGLKSRIKKAKIA